MKKMKSFRFCMINDVFSVSTKEMIFFHLGSEIIMMKMYENFDWKYFSQLIDFKAVHYFFYLFVCPSIYMILPNNFNLLQKRNSVNYNVFVK